MKPRVYSYIRFSTAEQSKGDSFRRQTDAAKRFAAAHGMAIDESLTMEDLGRSAYAGHHVSEGALGGFLAACEGGLVPPGSVLVVEAVDRLTRLDHLEAMSLIGRLVKHVDLHVVQLGRTFTNEVVRHDMGAIFTLIGAITLGHQESQQKGQRVGSAWAQKRKAARETGKRLTSKAPAWLRPTEDGFEPIPERVAIVRDMFERWVGGETMDSITRSMNDAGVPTWGRGEKWSRTYVHRILTSEATIGILKMGRKRKADVARTIVESVPDYFPKIIDDTLFSEAARRMKTGTKGRTPTTNPLAGVLRCPHCGGPIAREFKGARSRPKLVCRSRREGGGDAVCKSFRVDLERYWDAFKVGLVDRAKAAAEAYHPKPVADLTEQAEKARDELETIRAEVDKLDAPSVFLIGQVTKLEAHVQQLEEEIREAGRDVNLGWENLRDALADPATTPAEFSARLKVVFPNGIPLDPDLIAPPNGKKSGT